VGVVLAPFPPRVNDSAAIEFSSCVVVGSLVVVYRPIRVGRGEVSEGVVIPAPKLKGSPVPRPVRIPVSGSPRLTPSLLAIDNSAASTLLRKVSYCVGTVPPVSMAWTIA
jgi:hypothetical protein